MIRFFRRNRPAPPAPARLDPSEARIASAWGINEHEWRRLSDAARAHARANLTKAPRFTN